MSWQQELQFKRLRDKQFETRHNFRGGYLH